MDAKSFAYGCAAALILAAAAHFAVLRADAYYVDQTGAHIVGWVRSDALRSDGTVWRYTESSTGFTRHPLPALDPPVPVREIVFWNKFEFVTRSGEVYKYCEGSCLFRGETVGEGWHVVDTLPSPTVRVLETTTTDMKSKYKERKE